MTGAAAIAVFGAGVAAVIAAGTFLTAVADTLARRTQMGEALMGALFLGAVTSLSGAVTSVTAAASGHPSLAVSNAIGGIAAQTTFIVIADFFYRRSNLEYAASSQATLTQAALLIILLSVPLLAQVMPDATLWGVHPVSVILLAIFAFGMRLTSDADRRPTWHPRAASGSTPEAAREVRDPLAVLWLKFGASAVVVAASGLVLALTAPALADALAVKETAAGGFLTAVPTSLPELVTAVVAVRRGALVLAVSDILGGNCFDVLFLSFADAAYQGGSIYHAISLGDEAMLALALILTGILLLGMLRRERSGVANIGFEGPAILVVYLASAAMIFSL